MERLQTWWVTALYMPIDGDSCMEIPGDCEVVKAADAQATIAALQAQIEQVQEERSKYIQAVGLATTCAADMQIDTSHPIEMMQEVCKQFTQRTAELEAIEKILDIDSGKTTVEKVRDLHHSFKQVWESYQDASNEMFKAQAELERVRGLVKTYADAKIDFDDKRLQEDHHAWRERYTRLVGAETILIALTATSQEVL